MPVIASTTSKTELRQALDMLRSAGISAKAHKTGTKWWVSSSKPVTAQRLLIAHGFGSSVQSQNPILEAMGTGLGFGVGLYGIRKVLGNNPVSPKITDESKRIFVAYARDSVNWAGTPLVGGNVGGSVGERGNLTQLKRAGLITTQVDEGETWISFTAKGIEYAKSLKIDIPIHNPILGSLTPGSKFKLHGKSGIVIGNHKAWGKTSLVPVKLGQVVGSLPGDTKVNPLDIARSGFLWAQGYDRSAIEKVASNLERRGIHTAIRLIRPDSGNTVYLLFGDRPRPNPSSDEMEYRRLLLTRLKKLSPYAAPQWLTTKQLEDRIKKLEGRR